MNKITTLFVAWQQPGSGEWIPVARLDRKNTTYRFFYTQGVFRARGFHPFDGMDKLNSVYESSILLPMFANRMISRSRPEFKDYLRWLGLPGTTNDPMAILALTGGIRGTDSIELFQPPTVSDDGLYKLDFFARSLSHLPPGIVEIINTLSPESQLFLMRDVQNSFDNFAIALRVGSPGFFVGYCPKYYAKDLCKLLDYKNSELKVSVKCVNQDAPLNMRLLCSVTAKVPSKFSPLGNEEDFNGVADTFPNTWDNLATSLNDALRK